MMKPPDGLPPGTHAGVLTYNDARLPYWDTGGGGPVIVLAHAASGSWGSWRLQADALVRAGNRVIAYSRRGHEGSSYRDRGIAADDLFALADFLDVGLMHLVGHASGGVCALDFALAYEDRLASLMIVCSLLSIDEPTFARRVDALRPPGFADLPAWFRELGPVFRFANPRAAEEWTLREQTAVPGEPLMQGSSTSRDWKSLEQLTVPILLVSADADLYVPAPLLDEVALHLKNVRRAHISDSGHNPQLEQPGQFNGHVIEWVVANKTARESLPSSGGEEQLAQTPIDDSCRHHERSMR